MAELFLPVFIFIGFGLYLAFCFRVDQRLKVNKKGKILVIYMFSSLIYLSHAVTYTWLVYLTYGGKHHHFFIGLIVSGIVLYVRIFRRIDAIVLSVWITLIQGVFFLIYSPFVFIKWFLRCLFFIIRCPVLVLWNRLRGLFMREEIEKDESNDSASSVKRKN